MSDNGEYILQFKDFDRNIRSGWTRLQNDVDFCDITLVSDDNQIKAHKIVLSTCSPVLGHILKNNPHQHPLIYLLGIKFSHLVNLINFMYQGEIKIPQDEINDFLNLGRDLKVVGLSENEEDRVDEKTYKNDHDIKKKFNEFPIENINEALKNDFECFSCAKCPYTTTQKKSLILHLEVHDKSTLLKNKQDKVVDNNEAFVKKNNTHPSSKTDTEQNVVDINENDGKIGYTNYLLKADTEANVVGIKENDSKNNCTNASLKTDAVTENTQKIKRSSAELIEDSIFTTESKRNKMSSIIKDEVNQKFNYDQKDSFEPSHNYGYQERNFSDTACDDTKDLQRDITEAEFPTYNSNTEKAKENLNESLQNIHKCEQCNTKFAQPVSLARHMKSIHEKIRFSCEKCPVTATQSASLNRHVQAVHEKIRHFCIWCDYSATQKSSLNKHVKIKH